MAVSQGTIESLLDLLRTVGPLSVRRMFGAVAVYCDGQVFALVDDDIVYFKVDDSTRPNFAAEGCEPFKYVTKAGVEHVIGGYWRIPDRLLDEADELVDWARAAVMAGRRAAAAKAKKPLLAASRAPRKGPGRKRTTSGKI